MYFTRAEALQFVSLNLGRDLRAGQWQSLSFAGGECYMCASGDVHIQSTSKVLELTKVGGSWQKLGGSQLNAPGPGYATA